MWTSSIGRLVLYWSHAKCEFKLLKFSTGLKMLLTKVSNYLTELLNVFLTPLYLLVCFLGGSLVSLKSYGALCNSKLCLKYCNLGIITRLWLYSYICYWCLLYIQSMLWLNLILDSDFLRCLWVHNKCDKWVFNKGKFNLK